MNITSRQDWDGWRASCTMLPYVLAVKLATGRMPGWDELWSRAGREAFVLESGKGGRYTIAGIHPVSVIRGKGRTALIREGTGESGSERREEGAPLDLIQAWMAPYRSPKVEGAPKFTGGCVGFLGYDVVRSLERLPERAADDLGIPDYVMMRFEEIWIVDQEEQMLYCCVQTPVPAQASDDWTDAAYARAAERAEAMREIWLQWQKGDAAAAAAERSRTMAALLGEEEDPSSFDPERLEGLERAFDKEAFMSAVERIREYIAAGDVFQVNLSVRQSRRLISRPEHLYEWLRVLNPSPYMGMLRLGDFDLVSASPELLVQVEGHQVRTRPIAGTRKRGASPEEDRRMRDELLHNEKERAEHIMLVDLERNDLGRISKYGTVRVTELMAIEYYSHVMHIVSEVTGELAEGRDAYDVAAAAFPGGTITGAPKVRTMEIIEELEPVRRGPYTGSIGWIDYNGNMELNIIIRTLLACGDRAYVQAGAGIVIDSVPEREYKESLSKAKALWKAVDICEKNRLWE
ncbi:anthranilate synthase component I family protein [Gorillibacterium sp. sgz5001074]|uniref:anthranilate synthase component I family protein n=1 Tax=Gorillibacterium sp. sgz5001074 TaxID=3446695 RepID=UPI003F66EBD3